MPALSHISMLSLSSVLVIAVFSKCSRVSCLYCRPYRLVNRKFLRAPASSTCASYLLQFRATIITFRATLIESPATHTVLCSSCSRRPTQSPQYKTCLACRQKAHRQRLRRRSLSTTEVPTSLSTVQSLPPSTTLPSPIQRTLCSYCGRP